MPVELNPGVVGIFPNDAAITRLVGSQLLEQQEEWPLECRRFFSEASMVKIPEPEEAFVLTHEETADQATTTASRNAAASASVYTTLLDPARTYLESLQREDLELLEQHSIEAST
jgi:hypothetical protein